MIYLVTLYLLGCVACYFVCRSAVYDKNNEKKWTNLEKIIVANLSLMSWLSLSILFLVAILCVIKVIDPDKKVTW